MVIGLYSEPEGSTDSDTKLLTFQFSVILPCFQASAGCKRDFFVRNPIISVSSHKLRPTQKKIFISLLVASK